MVFRRAGAGLIDQMLAADLIATAKVVVQVDNIPAHAFSLITTAYAVE